MVKFSELTYPDRYQRRALVGDAATCLAKYNRAARGAASRVLADDIDPRSYAILYRLLDGEKKQRWLQQELGVPAGSMQLLKKKLVAAGLILDPDELINAKRSETEKRDSARQNRKSDLKRGGHVFRLTARGDLEIRGRIGIAQSIWEIGLDALDDDELRSFVTLIQKMRAALDARLVTRPRRATSSPAPVRVSDEPDCNLNHSGDLERENHSSLNAPSDYCANADLLPSNGSVSEDGNGGSMLFNDDQPADSGSTREITHENGAVISFNDERNWPDEEDEEDGDPPLAEHEHMIRHQERLDREEEERWREADARWSKPFPGIAARVSDHLIAIAAVSNTLDDFDGGPKEFNFVRYEHTIKPPRFNPYRIIKNAEKAGTEIAAFFEDRDTSTVRHIGFRAPVNRIRLRWLADDGKAFKTEALRCMHDLSDAGLLTPHVLVFQFKVDEQTQLVDVHCHAIADMQEDARADVLDLLEDRFIHCWIDESPDRDPASTMEYIHPGFSLPNMETWSSETLEELYYALRSERFVHYFGAFKDERKRH